MSTNDVPGTNPDNNDELAMGCWAEHDDGSLIFVESTEGNRIIYSIFDMSKAPIVEYRDAMPENSFKKTFSWDGAKGEKWTWHDKTPFPWDRVIKAGAEDGPRYASAADHLTAAERVAQSLKLRGEEFDEEKTGDRHERTLARIGGLLRKIGDAISDLRK